MSGRRRSSDSLPGTPTDTSDPGLFTPRPAGPRAAGAGSPGRSSPGRSSPGRAARRSSSGSRRRSSDRRTVEALTASLKAAVVEDCSNDQLVPQLASYQQEVVKRFASRCRGQFGLLMFHKAGSGKTISSLSILLSLPTTGKRALIMCPKSIRSTYGRDSNDMKTLFPTAFARHAFAETFEVMALAESEDSLQAYVSRVDFMADISEKRRYLKNLFKDRVIIVDEAHNMIPLIRQYSDVMYDAFNSAKHVILLTGTPILAQTSDWGVLMRIVSRGESANPDENPDNFIPTVEEAFVQEFTNADKLSSAKFQIVDGARAVISNFIIPEVPTLLAFAVTVAGNYASTLLADTSLSDYAAPEYNVLNSNGTMTLVPQVDGPITSVETNANALWTSFAAGALAAVAGKAVQALGPTVAGLAATYGPGAAKRVYVGTVSTEVNKSLAQFGALTTFRNEIDLVSLVKRSKKYVSFFDYETAPADEEGILPSQFFPRKSIGAPILVRLDDFQTERLISVFVSPGSVYGKEAKYIEQTRRMLGMSDLENFTDLSVFKKYMPALSNLSPDVLTHRAVKNGDDGDIMANEYVHYAAEPRRGSAAAKLTRAFACEKFDKLLSVLQAMRSDKSTYCAYEVKPGNRYKEFTKARPVKTPNERYLPVVYTNYDEAGLQLFSAYLHSVGEKHFVYLASDTNERRIYLEENCIKRRWTVGADDEPLCIILHPTIRESLSFTHSPALICMERISGFGFQEQVQARILRRYNSAQDEDARPIKYLIQCASSPRTQTATLTRAGDYELSDTFDFRYRKSWTKAYFKEAGPNPLAFKTVESRLLPFQDSVESIINRDNLLQANVFEGLLKQFKDQTDQALGAACGAPKCVPCLKGQCSQCDCPSRT